MAESKEYTTLMKCTPKLELQLRNDRDILHALYKEGLLGKDVYDDALTPRTMLSEAQRAGEVVREIKRIVSINHKKYGVLLEVFRQNPRVYGDILEALNVEYGGAPTSSLTGGGIPSREANTGTVKVYESFNQSMSVDELSLWLQKMQLPPNDATIIKDKNIGGIVFKLSPLEDFRGYGVSNVGMMVLKHLKEQISPDIPQASPIQVNPTPPHPTATPVDADHTNNSPLASTQPFKLKYIKAALSELSPTKYVDLAAELGLPRKSVVKHETNWPRDSERVLTELINEWIDSKVDASWKTLKKALISMKLAGIAKNI